MKPTIAVVIPNFNDSETLKQCLDSVFEQDQRPEQVIVVDDQSTDKSLEILQACLRDVPVAKLIVNPVRVGTMAALNAGLEHVTADYALFLSANDFLKPGIFLRARDRIAADGYPGVWSAMVSTIDENGARAISTPATRP